MSALHDIAAACRARPVPILFLDTCAILDIARAPERRQPDTVEAAAALVASVAQAPPGVHLLIADVVRTEWGIRLASPIETMREALQKFSDVAAVANYTGMGFYPPTETAQTQAGLAANLESRCRDFFAACILIDRRRPQRTPP